MASSGVPDMIESAFRRRHAALSGKSNLLKLDVGVSLSQDAVRS
jgi:hypothetical protein